jgi:hypothetical protein
MKPSCKTCRWLLRPRNAEGQLVRTTSRNTYQCTWPMPEIKLPLSITSSYRASSWRNPNRRFMGVYEGAECATYDEVILLEEVAK